jgi:hypothetical protein
VTRRGLVALPTGLLPCLALLRPPPINLLHDLFSPANRVGNCSDGCRNPLSAIVLRQLPRRQNCRHDSKHALSTFIHRAAPGRNLTQRLRWVTSLSLSLSYFVRLRTKLPIWGLDYGSSGAGKRTLAPSKNHWGDFTVKRDTWVGWEPTSLARATVAELWLTPC